MGRRKSLVLAINPGSSSTKLALYSGESAVFSETIRHADDERAPLSAGTIWNQLDDRIQTIEAALGRHGVSVGRIDGFVARGGLLKPVESGTYRVNDQMLEDLRRGERGEHASNLGAPLAHMLAERAGGGQAALIIDPVSVDEWPQVARLSGLAGLDRECLSHALNTKAVSKRYAREQGRAYQELRLIVAHLGSGISVSAHRGGRMIDVTNSREEGAFSTERAGTLPVMKLVDLCFSGEYSRNDLERKIFREGGICSYLGTKDLEEVLGRCQRGDEEARLTVEALIYQIGKEIGAMASVLEGRVDAVLLTGGMAHAQALVQGLGRRVDWIAPIHLYPGEDELRALAEGALRVLRGEESALEYA